MAVNTAYVASSELLERVAHRYRFDWLVGDQPARLALPHPHPERRRSTPASSCSPRGSQAILAEMYAIGLLASFCINIGCLLIYRYFRARRRSATTTRRASARCCSSSSWSPASSTSRSHKPYGTGAVGGVVGVLLAAGIPFSRRYGPEVQQKRRSDYPMEMLLALGEADGPLHVYFRRPGELDVAHAGAGHGVRHLLLAAPGDPRRSSAPNHYRFPIQGGSVYRSIAAILDAARGGARRPRRHTSTSAGRRRRGSTAWRRASSSPT